MHELGIMREIVKVTVQAAVKNKIKTIKHITLEVGTDSGLVPQYMKKMFPIAADSFPILRKTELRILTVCGKGLLLKDIGY